MIKAIKNLFSRSDEKKENKITFYVMFKCTKTLYIKYTSEIYFVAIPKILKIDFVYYKYNLVQIWAYYFNKAKSINTMFEEENYIISNLR